MPKTVISETKSSLEYFSGSICRGLRGGYGLFRYSVE